MRVLILACLLGMAPVAGSAEPVSVALFADSFGYRPAPGFYRAAAMAPDLAVILGDWDHRGPHTLEAMRRMHQTLLYGGSKLGDDWIASGLAALPLLKTWSDHDMGASDSSRRCPCLPAALIAWGEFHTFSADHGYPLGIWQRAVVGPVAFFILDTRSNRNPSNRASERTMLGAVQLAWLKARLLAETAPWKVIVTAEPFNPSIHKNRDSWQGYLAERQGLVDFIAAHAIRNVVFVSGDIHSGGALDDGANNSGFPELSVPLANAGFAGTSNPGRWSVGRHPDSAPGFGWLTATESTLTLAAYGADGALRLSYTVER